jgi:hypothetical protein
MRAALLLASLLWTASAHAVTPLCVEVRSDLDEPGVRKLVADELRHHPSHRLAETDCASVLTVEIFGTAGVHYLTARINQEVPVRFAIKGVRDLEDKLSEALGLVLKNDPVYLAEDLSHLSAFMRASTNLIKRGSNRYRVELFELFGWGSRNAVFASGAAFGLFRGIDHAQVFLRIEAAGAQRNLGDDVTLRAMAGFEVGALWEASARANTTFYIGPGLSLHWSRFEGRVPVMGTPVEQPAAMPWLFSAVLRTGVRFLRFYDFDIDLFAQVHLPLHPTRDTDSPLLVSGYTPYAMAGIGVGF